MDSQRTTYQTELLRVGNLQGYQPGQHPAMRELSQALAVPHADQTSKRHHPCHKQSVVLRL